MKLLCVGLNWRTPIRIRERLAFDPSQAARALAKLKAERPAVESAILSTCNRTEIYAAWADTPNGIDTERLCQFLADARGLVLAELRDYLYACEGTQAALHLFKVASGLDSLVIGETQILGQVRQAYVQASAGKTVGPILHTLFQRALGVGKRVRRETGLTRGRLSIASAGVDYLRGVFERFDDKTVLVIGAGKMAELVLTHLKELEPKAVLVCNRNRERAEELVLRMGGGGSVRPFEQLIASLAEADIVVSSTGAEQPLVYAHQFPAVMSVRWYRLMAILDLAVPRDFDPAIAELDNVLLWNIDDLDKVTRNTLREREQELDKAMTMIDAELRDFQGTLALQRSSPVLGRLEQEYQQVIEQELARLIPQLDGVTADSLEKIRQFAHRLKNKFLHPPKAALRAETHSGRQRRLLNALRQLFGLSDD